jgi:hypothetical protein
MFRDDVMRVMIQQEDQLVFVINNTNYCYFLQNQQQDQQLTIARVSTVDDDKIDYDEMPDFVLKNQKRPCNQCSN